MRNDTTRFVLSGAGRPNLRHLPEAPGEFFKVHLLGPPQRSGIRSDGVEALACASPPPAPRKASPGILLWALG